jgi:hypothetical protein
MTMNNPACDYVFSGSMRIETLFGSHLERETSDLVFQCGSYMGMSESYVRETTYDDIISPSNKSESTSGRLYDSEYGYIDITTPSAWRYSDVFYETPDLGGDLLLIGEGGNSILVSIIDDTWIQVELDLDGDQLNEVSRRLMWTELSSEIGSDLSDTDNDGMHDGWEVVYGLDPDVEGDALLDTDNDGFYNFIEYEKRTDPSDIISFPPFEVSARASDIKEIRFDWYAVSGATKYKLLVNPDGVSGYSLLQDNIVNTSTTLEISVHLTDWINASYILEVYDGTGKLKESSPVYITELMNPTVGYFKANDPSERDNFGYDISLSADGNTMAVGAYTEDSAAFDAGAVYVFYRNGNIWNQQAILTGSNAALTDYFGSAVSLSSDGDTLVVGAHNDGTFNAGAVYVFSRSGSTWIEKAYIKGSNTSGSGDNFGHAVSISGDGNTLVVGAVHEDSNFSGISTDGTGEANNLLLGSGAVYVFNRSGDIWTQQAYVKASNAGEDDWFGSAVSLSTDGNTLAVGAYLEDSNATAISTDGSGGLDDTAKDSGAVYIFSRSAGVWTQQAYIKASNTDANDLFGGSVSLSANGNTLVVGAIGEDSNVTGISIDGTGESDNSSGFSGAAYLFSRNGSIWTQQSYIKSSNTWEADYFGHDVSISADGNTLAVAAGREDSQTGAVYVFNRKANAWSQRNHVKASNAIAYDRFGSAVSLSADGNSLAVGAHQEDSNSSGIGGNQANNSLYNAGAAYLY